LSVKDGEKEKIPERRGIAKSLWQRFVHLDVLLVEDIEINREVIAELLALVGLRVRMAGNGKEALEQIEQKKPDLVLMDCQMPVMDGFAATRLLRANPAFRAIPVIALTANASNEDRQACLDAGMNAHVAKPIQMEKLYEEFARCFPESAERQGAPEDLSAAQQFSMHELPRIPGIAMAAALVHVGGKYPLLKRILQRFRNDYVQGFAARYSEAFDQGDYKTSLRLVHSLKGVASTVGAIELAEAAKLLENAVARHDDEACELALAEVLSCLRVLGDGLACLDNLPAQ
jgi:CheY-like chemotaxis protein